MASTDEAATGHQRSSRHKIRVRWIIAGLAVVCALIGLRVLLQYLDAPTSAAKVMNQPASVAAPAERSGKPVPVSNAYAQFSYPSFLTPLKQQQPAGGSTLAAYGYEYHAAVPWQLTVTINYVPGSLANNDSAYYAMVQNAARYQKTMETVNGHPVTVVTDLTAGGFSKIAFLFHGTYSANIAVNGIDQQYTEQEQATLDQIVKSWNWQ